MLQTKHVKRNQQWYQSPRSDSWEKQLQREPKLTQNKYHFQTHFIPNTPQRPKHTKHISPEGKQLLKNKVEEVVSFNSLKTTKPQENKNHKQLGEDTSVSRRDKRARCYICKKRGHIYWECTNKGIKEEKDMSDMDHKIIATPPVNEAFKYEPERVHMDVDFMVEGSDKGNWDDIWYVSSAYKKHMSPNEKKVQGRRNRRKGKEVYCVVWCRRSFYGDK